MQAARLGADDELARGGARRILEQRGGGADEVSAAQDGLFALGMRDELGLRVSLHEGGQLSLAERLVHDAAALPEDHLAPRLFLEKSAEILVRGEEDGSLGGDC